MQLLSHHLSLPKSSSTASDMVSVDKYLQLQDSVPYKIRAKRGCATHPRSIAERVTSTSSRPSLHMNRSPFEAYSSLILEV